MAEKSRAFCLTSGRIIPGMARLSRTPVFRGKSRILFSVFRGGKPVTLPESRGKIKLVLKTDLLCDFLDAQRGARQQPAGPDHPLFSQILAWSYSVGHLYLFG
ncbi:MAG: hypothetical protein MR727_05890, partial [Lentisphaeria bacterium]|nr:hypothetical protein [Lentisphaeria bacterium]